MGIGDIYCEKDEREARNEARDLKLESEVLTNAGLSPVVVEMRERLLKIKGLAQEGRKSRSGACRGLAAKILTLIP